VAAGIALTPAEAWAQAAPVKDNGYALEFLTGPLIAPVRVTGFGGAFSAAAESVDGGAVNAAAPAVREPFSFDWFDYDLNLDISFPGAYGGTDFDNRGQQANQDLRDKVDSFLYLNLGAQLQFGELGSSVTAEFLQYAISPAQAGTPGLNLTLGRYHALAAYGLAGNQFVVGSGLRGVTAQVNQQGGGEATRTLLTMTGIAPEVGVVIKPDNLPYRLGATARAPVSGKSFGRGAIQEDANGVERAGPFILPSRVVLPWEFEAGVAFQLGPRPLNPPWINPHDVERPLSDRIAAARALRDHENAVELEKLPEPQRSARRAQILREEQSLRALEDAHMDQESQRLRDVRKARFENWPRERLLILASVLVAGASDSAVALEGFLEQKLDYVGRSVTVTPRFGFESEPIVNFLRARVGTYIEPSRFEDGHARQHFTFGADFRLFPFSPFGIFGDQVWRAGFASDLAPRYANWGFGIGAWH
jgi:hypothetical protein